jgi:hypothetical protein
MNMADQEEIDQTDDLEQDAEPGKPKLTRKKRRNPLVQLQESIDDLAEMAKDSSLKPNNRADLQLRRADAILSLAKLSADKADSEALAENISLKTQLEQDAARTSSLEGEVASLKASQHPIQTVTVPDPDAASIRADLANARDLILSAGQAVKQVVGETDRLRLAALLAKRSGRGAQSMISEMGVDFASIWMASQESSETLTARIDAASPEGQRGAAVLVAKSTLAARGQDYVYVGPRSTKPVYADVFYELDGR